MIIPSAFFAHFAAFGLVQCSSYAKPKECVRIVPMSSAYLWIRFKRYSKCPALHVSDMRYERVCKHFFLKAIFLCSNWSRMVQMKLLHRGSLSEMTGWGIRERIWINVCVHDGKKIHEYNNYYRLNSDFLQSLKSPRLKNWDAYRQRLIPITNSQLIIYFSH